MPKPFPFPLNIGTDICHSPRIFTILRQKRIARRFIKRVLTEEEIIENWHRIEGPLARWEKVARNRDLLISKGGLPIAKDRKSVDGHGEQAEELLMAESSVKGVSWKDIWKDVSNNNRNEQKEVGKELMEVARFMAGRFAAKEAAMKAHHSRRLTYHDIVIRRPPDREEGSRAPVAVILPERKSGEQGWEDGQECKISISHDGDYAMATCLAIEPGTGTGIRE